MTPFLLKPALRDYLWGGTRLKDEWGKQTDRDIIAESWELSALPESSSVIASGEYRGMAFAEFCLRFPNAIGAARTRLGEFPILIKLIDAKQALSVQVHPDDAYAERIERGAGKTEVWIVLDAEPGAGLYYGLRRELTREELVGHIYENTLTQELRQIAAKPGDVFFIPAGTLHAIGAGLLIAEVQQSSDSTYRVYDYGRTGADGRPRELHIEKAVEVAALTPTPMTAPGADDAVSAAGGQRQRLTACPFFIVDRLSLAGRWQGAADQEGFTHLLCIGGEAELTSEHETLTLRRGDSAFIPAGITGYTLTGQAEILMSGAGEA